jgi:hypothetical protein
MIFAGYKQCECEKNMRLRALPVTMVPQQALHAWDRHQFPIKLCQRGNHFKASPPVRGRRVDLCAGTGQCL